MYRPSSQVRGRKPRVQFYREFEILKRPCRITCNAPGIPAVIIHLRIFRLEFYGIVEILKRCGRFAGGVARSIQDLRQLLKAQSTDKTEVKPEHFTALENRQILLRLQNNIKVRRIQEGDLKGAERALQRMLWIAPAHAELWRESGILNIRLDNLLAARRALTRYLELADNDQQRQRAARLLQELGQQLH